MKKWLTTLAFAAVLVLGACGGGDEAKEEDTGATTEEQAEGEVLYQQSCSSCHGEDLSGEAAPGLTEVGSKYDEDEIKEIILEGKGSMPPISVEDDEAAEIASWLAAKK